MTIDQSLETKWNHKVIQEPRVYLPPKGEIKQKIQTQIQMTMNNRTPEITQHTKQLASPLRVPAKNKVLETPR